jgi:hypothetical protein
LHPNGELSEIVFAKKIRITSPWTANGELSEIEFGQNTDELLLGQRLQTHRYDVIRK